VAITLRLTSKSIIHDVIEGEAVVMNLESGIYYSFNNPATVIWKHLVEESTDETNLRDLIGDQNQNFIDFLLAEGLVMRQDQAVTDENIATTFSTIKSLAEWQTFSDMKDLLLLDPVHDIAIAENGWPKSFEQPSSQE
jgi:hypothetical protein